MAASSSRGRSSSPFGYRKPSTPYSSTSSSSSMINGRLMPRSCSSSTTSFYGGGGYGSRSMTPSRNKGDYSRSRTPVSYPSMEEPPIGEPAESASRSGDSISVTIRFRPLSEREYQRGDEIAWYADGDKIVRNEYNPMTAYAFDRVFGPSTSTQEVYEVAARPVVKAAMEGVNGTVFAYGVTSSGKTHTMHGDQNSPGIIPLAIKDVFSIIQETPGREFLLRVSYLEIYNEVINDLLDPTGQNLRVREDAQMIESSAHGDDYDGVIFSQLNLIDLAGSESSKTETTGLRRKEGSYINKSLLTLGTIIDEKSLIKKYQREISCLKEELEQLRRGMLAGVSHEEIMVLRQQLEEGQSKMQSRLEEEEEAKAALMSRIQRLTKLILVSSKNTIPGCTSDMPSHHRSHSGLEEDGLDVPHDVSLKRAGRHQKDSPSSALTITSDAYDFKHRRSSSKWNDDISQAGSTITETTQVGELICVSSKVPMDGLTMSDEMDLLVEQVKVLAGEIAFSTSTLKRLVEQSVNDPESSKTQIENLEREIHEKRKQMRVLEQRIVENGEASVANASMVEMQQTVMKLMAQCSEKSFELEIKSADNRVLQEQLQNKQLASVSGDKMSSPSEMCISDEYADGLRKKMQSQARMQEMKEKELRYTGNGDANSHVCKGFVIVLHPLPACYFPKWQNRDFGGKDISEERPVRNFVAATEVKKNEFPLPGIEPGSPG
ncbi:UNVERIFIED_CONTAM: Kinesin-like protein KIN-7D, mitochondrial [Sesamum radiatum]|uniref:Kinesin-like protein n=1 Tax=Sesamum radiatum TaxID=300843 RepID=A0AAW2UA12_SESRA